jgi:hypothetical protein
VPCIVCKFKRAVRHLLGNVDNNPFFLLSRPTNRRYSPQDVSHILSPSLRRYLLVSWKYPVSLYLISYNAHKKAVKGTQESFEFSIITKSIVHALSSRLLYLVSLNDRILNKTSALLPNKPNRLSGTGTRQYKAVPVSSLAIHIPGNHDWSEQPCRLA